MFNFKLISSYFDCIGFELFSFDIDFADKVFSLGICYLDLGGSKSGCLLSFNIGRGIYTKVDFLYFNLLKEYLRGKYLN